MKSKGFTLIELMIVVAMIAILAAIAVPAFECATKGGPQCKKKQEQQNITHQQDAPQQEITRK